MATLNEIRAKLQALDNKSGGNQSNNQDKTVFPFWDIDNGSSATIRFLPDGNNDNVFFWVEKQMIRLDFPGIKGGDENKHVTITVPCVEMFDGPNTCPIQNEVRPWWKDTSMEDMARKYWKKKSYIFHGFVNDSKMTETDTPDNPIRRFNINGQLFKIIKAALLDPDFENVPSDYINGTDFIINKTVNGKFADYSTSKYARRETALTETQLLAVEKYGLANLNDYLPPRPSADHLTAQFEMFEASVAGELYDPVRWAKFYKPYGLNVSESNATSKPVSAPKKPVVVDEDDYNDAEDSAVPVSSKPASNKAEDIIAALRARKAQSQ